MKTSTIVAARSAHGGFGSGDFAARAQDFSGARISSPDQSDGSPRGPLETVGFPKPSASPLYFARCCKSPAAHHGNRSSTVWDAGPASQNAGHVKSTDLARSAEHHWEQPNEALDRRTQGSNLARSICVGSPAGV